MSDMMLKTPTAMDAEIGSPKREPKSGDSDGFHRGAGNAWVPEVAYEIFRIIQLVEDGHDYD